MTSMNYIYFNRGKCNISRGPGWINYLGSWIT